MLRAVSERPAAVLDQPLVGWMAVDIPPDGSLHPVLGCDWTDPVQSAPQCRLHPQARRSRDEPFLGGALHPVVAATHEAPAPFCVCGLGALYTLRLHRRFDVFRDRLGYRLRCLAIVQLWGRVMLESGGVRAEYGRVLAIVVPQGEAGSRLRRIEAAAERLQTRILTVDPDAFDEEELLRRQAPEGSLVVSHSDFMRCAGNTRTRRWRSVRKQREAGRTVRLMGSALGLMTLGVVAGAAAIGVSPGLATVFSILVGLLALTVIAPSRRAVAVEALAPAPPACPTPAARALPVARGPAQGKALAALGDLMTLWR